MSTPITNSGATTDVPTNFEIDDRTGFKMYPGELVRDGQIKGLYVSEKSRDDRHPQDLIKSVQGRQYGPRSPELDDSFISTSVTPESL